MKLHPDKNQSSNTEHFQEVREAWDVLGDPKERGKYDNERRRAKGYAKPDKTAPSGSKMESSFPTLSRNARQDNRPPPAANNEQRGATGYEKRNNPKAFGTDREPSTNASKSSTKQFSERKYKVFRRPNGEWTPFPGLREKDRSPE
ncbi:hypothetical protein BJY01DRAFT_209756 [Aspergillus pseudoustus]|uniref:J domain-containing protein n=1 Tax=Aspergillus pseudoustus TaxID=1810923 RepID=A0ABR4KEI0_9EURO